MKIGHLIEGLDYDRDKLIWETITDSNQTTNIVMGIYHELDDQTFDFNTDIYLDASVVLGFLDDLYYIEHLLVKPSEVFKVYNYMIDYLRKVNTYK